MGPSHFSTSCQQGTDYLLFPRMLALQVALDNRDGVSLQSKGQARLLPILTDLGTLSSGFLSYGRTHWVSKCHLVIFIPTLCELGLRQPTQKTKIC